MPLEKSRATEFWLSIERSILTAMEKSAEGIIGRKTSLAQARRSHNAEGPNG